MKHAFIDTYADLDTPVHRLEPRVKVVGAVVFLFTIILTPITCKVYFLFYALAVFFLIHLSKIPPYFIFKRLANIFPFIIIVSVSMLFRRHGYVLFIGCLIKSGLATLLMLLISSTTKFSQLLDALKRLGMPVLFISLFSFMYRYSFLLEDQILRSMRAYESRSTGKLNNRAKVKIFGNILGTIFIRTYERAERVYLAMCARGYANEKSD